MKQESRKGRDGPHHRRSSCFPHRARAPETRQPGEHGGREGAFGLDQSDTTSANSQSHTPTTKQNTHRRCLRIRNVSSPTAREQVFFDRVNDLEVEASKEAWDREKYIEEQEEIEASGQAHPRETHIEEQVEIETSREAHLRSTESTEAAGAEEEPHNTVAGREAHCGACRVAMTVSPRFRGRTPSCVE